MTLRIKNLDSCACNTGVYKKYGYKCVNCSLKANAMPPNDCAICGEDHQGNAPLSCETGDGV